MRYLFFLIFVFSQYYFLNSQERIIKIDNAEFNIKIFGKGNLTIIFESGMSIPYKDWNYIGDSVSSNAKVLLYDRAGIGKSSISDKARTIPNLINDLEKILKHENLNPPFLFVAHSSSTYLARYYAYQYPKKIAGLILISPTPEDYYNDMKEKELAKFLKKGNKYFSKKNEGSFLEWKSFYDNRMYMSNCLIDNNIPIILISSYDGYIRDYQRKMFNYHTNIEFIEIDKNPGFLFALRQDIIIRYINLMIDKINGTQHKNKPH